MSRSAVDQAAVGSWLVRDSNPRTLTGASACLGAASRPRARVSKRSTIDGDRRRSTIDGGDGNGDDDEER